MEVFRARKDFYWDGWGYAPNGSCGCACWLERDKTPTNCTGVTGTGCECHDTSCHCRCGIPMGRYAGDIFLINEAHPLKEIMLETRNIVYDASIPSAEVLLDKPEYQRLLTPWQQKASKR